MKMPCTDHRAAASLDHGQSGDVLVERLLAREVEIAEVARVVLPLRELDASEATAVTRAATRG
jgi:hypothetical protein